MATRVGKRLCGIVYGGNGRLLGANLIAIAVIIGWTALLMYTLFK